MENRTIQEYVYELIDLCEKSELPGVDEHIVELKGEILKKFSRNEILQAGIVL